MPQVDVVIKGHDQLSPTMRECRGSVTDFNQALEVAGKVARTVGQIYEATVGEFIDYATEVRTLSSVTGQSAESSSRLIQVMDDFNISGDQVTVMLRTMAKEGLTPNIETIASLSDRYLALAPGVERATFLQQNFGRSGADLAYVMDQGSAAILDRNARVSEMLILDEQALADAREMELAVDDLKDAWLGIELLFAGTVIPTLADLTRGVAAVFEHEEGDNFVEWLQGIFVQGLEHSLGYVTPLTTAIAAVGDAAVDTTADIADLSYQQLLAAAMEAGLAGDYALESHYRRQAAAIRGARDALAEYIALAETDWGGWASESRFVASTVGGTQPGTAPGVWTAENANYLSRKRHWERLHPGQTYSGAAAGGPLGLITEVGEEGTEGIINGMVIPHDLWERLKRMGLQVDQQAMTVGEGGTGVYVAPKPPAPKGTSKKGSVSGGGYISGGGGEVAGGGGVLVADIVEEVQQASPQESAALVASIPAAAASAASEQGRQQVAEARNIGNDTILVLRRIEREIAKLNQTFSTVVRDAVERVM